MVVKARTRVAACDVPGPVPGSWAQLEPLSLARLYIVRIAMPKFRYSQPGGLTLRRRVNRICISAQVDSIRCASLARPGQPRAVRAGPNSMSVCVRCMVADARLHDL